MRIGIYADIEFGVPGGVQQYIEKIVKALVENTSEQIFVITNKVFYDNYFKNLKKNTNFTYILSKKDEYAMKEIIYKLNLDVLHFPMQTFTYFYWNLPTVITLHDLQHKIFPEFFSEKEIKYRDLYYRQSAEMCDQIIVSFNHVKKDIIKFFNICDHKITVAALGIENRDKMLLDSNIDIFSKYKINHKFILYPAQTWKHKNHIRLLKAIKFIKQKFNKNIYLVCTGKKNEYFETIKKYISDNNLDKNVNFLGFVSDEDLQSLYKKASIVVIPTLYEAGSFPLFEAMSLGVPVICSNVTSLPGTIGDNRFVFNPHDIKEMAVKINEMMNNKELIQANIENSNIQIKRFSWKNMIQNFITSYKIAINHFNLYKKCEELYNNRIVIENNHECEIERINNIIDSIPINKRIVIYAAGVHTEYLIRDTNLSIKNIICVVDKYSHKKNILGYKIENVEKINEIKSDIIIISSFTYQDEIYKYLKLDLHYSGKIIKMYDDNCKKPFYE